MSATKINLYLVLHLFKTTAAQLPTHSQSTIHLF